MTDRLRRWAKQWLLVAGLAMLVSEQGYRFGLLEPLENFYSDFWHQLAGVRFQPQHVALVTVDDQSLAGQEDTPLVFWTPQFARAVDVLERVGARAVGLDFLPAITPEGWLRRIEGIESSGLHDYDLSFRQQINRGRLVLVATHAGDPAGGEDTLFLPHQDYLLSLPGMDIPSFIGFGNLDADADGGIRRFTARPALNLPAELREGAPRQSFPALLAQRATGREPPSAGLITFAGPPGTVPAVPIFRLLAEHAEADPMVRALAGKVVIIGGNFQGMGDIHFTPYSRGSVFGASGQLMPGPEIQASIVETLISGHSTAPLPTPFRWLAIGGLILGATVLYSRLSPGGGLLVLMAAGGLAFLLGVWSFASDRIFPAAHLQLGLLIAFVLAYGRRLSREAREKVRMRQMFSRYVSDDLVEIILTADRAPDLGGAYADVTVLFSDIRNFTSISERLDAHEVVEFLNAYFERACDCVLANGGSIDKFIGDAIMVEFGSPLPYPDHARRALRTALEMQGVAAEFAGWMAERFPDRGLPPFAVGIGIHSGPAVVGNVGSSRRMEFTAIGDTVNLASRLEGATKDAGCVILASQDTVAAAGEGVQTGRTATIRVKGREQAVEVVEIVGLVDS